MKDSRDKVPPASWWKAMDKFYARHKIEPIIKQELKEQKELNKTLGKFKKKFIEWASLERMYYNADLRDEIDCFFGNEIHLSRAERTNVKKWIALTKRIFERDNYICSYCGERGGKLECDHIMPISKCGSDKENNLTTSCR